MKHGLIGAVLMLATAFPAFATDNDVGVREAYQAYRTTVDQLSRGDLVSPVTAAVGVMVAQGVALLREAGRPDLAAKYEAEWAQRYNRPLTAEDWVPKPKPFDDLGDHDPASKWLADFYDTLMRVTQGIAHQFRVIEDINSMNYALPVVFAPKGTWRTASLDADQIEYRKHFIPMANIVTYWTANGLCVWACTTYAPEVPQLKKLCKPAAERLEHDMGRYVAWKISDYVFAMANNNTRDAEIAQMAILDYRSFLAQIHGGAL